MGYTRLLQTLKQAGFLLNLFKQIRSAIFCARNVPRKFQNCFDFKKKCQQFCRKKYANFPQKYANIRKSAQIGISSLLRFVNVAHRIKSQLEGTKLVLSGKDACFKQSVLKYIEYSCMRQALNLWWLQSPTQTLRIWGRRGIVTSKSNGWIVNTFFLRKGGRRWQSELL